VIKALEAAREMGIVTVGLLGGSGEPALGWCDLALVVPDTETARIQECHIALGHAVLELLEDRLVHRPVS
jgi:D-sedoheptulose 7-phosphate isomerase